MDCRFQKPFRFEHMWMSDKGCSETIEAVWSENSFEPWDTRVLKKIDRWGQELTRWSRKSFGSVRKELERKKKQLKEAKKRAIQTRDSRHMKWLEGEVNVLLDKEAKMWRQRFKVMWLKDGDRNTRFFHSKASQRRRRNYITQLYDATGRWCTRQGQVNDTIVDFYQNLFTSANPSNFEEVVDLIPQVVTNKMNEKLVADFTIEEVEVALKQMAHLKAPGPDGMPLLFYQCYWSLLGSDVSHSILHYLNSGDLPPELCHSFITLIPKVKEPKHVSEFQPINLSNVLYRIFAKVLTNRLQDVLPQIISKHQSAFMFERLISDNILVAFETLHYMRNHTKGKSGFMALKLDMSKAYDKVEWAYMEKVLVQLGFHDRWVKLMMACITTASYSVLINGEPHGHITPSRGLRQGDPLSPYLFLMCTEGLHGLIRSAANNGDIRGVSLCRNGPKLTHLLFADDSLIFCRAKIEEC